MKRNRYGNVDPIEKNGKVFHYWESPEIARIKRLGSAKTKEQLAARLYSPNIFTDRPKREVWIPDSEWCRRISASACIVCAPPHQSKVNCPRCKATHEGMIGASYSACYECGKIFGDPSNGNGKPKR